MEAATETPLMVFVVLFLVAHAIPKPRHHLVWLGDVLRALGASAGVEIAGREGSRLCTSSDEGDLVRDELRFLTIMEQNIDSFRCGDMSLALLVWVLEGVVHDLDERGVAGVDDLSDAWEKLETHNALALEGRGLLA